ncbi:MAG: peptidylprolyl isomerase [Actinobacteria bacterium]|nr:peptidylprolyl isomerase [Actinomycetota bacterium]
MAPDRVLASRTLKRTMRTIVFDTNCGEIVIEPFHDDAPMALTAIRALIRGGYYDETLCHRLTTEGLFVLQCGDPTASGYGGPNFTFGLENLPENKVANYPAGIVAMANSGRPPVNGSQFFFVYEDTTLAPSYTIWGRVTKGFDIIKMIAKAGTKDGSNNGMPKQTIAIERALIR